MVKKQKRSSISDVALDYARYQANYKMKKYRKKPLKPRRPRELGVDELTLGIKL